jgi:programmed cell death protein 5
MASEEELERIRARRLAELQTQQQQTEQMQRAQEEAEAQKQALMRKILTPKARQRMTNIKMVRPEYGEQLELQLLQLAQTGRIKIPIDDDVLKRLLSQLQGSSRREINIRRV